MRQILFTLVLVFVAAVAARAQVGKIVSDHAVMRGTPSSTGKWVESLGKGAEFRILAKQGDWYLIQSVDMTGWLTSDLFTFVTRELVQETSARPAEQDLPRTVMVPSSPASNAPSTPTVTASVVLNTPSAPNSGQPDPSTATGKCADGTLTFSVEKQGACSDHGGVADWFAETRTVAPQHVPAGTDVHVKGYYRKDGTYVQPHTRSAPSKRH